MTEDLGTRLARLARAVRDGRGAVLMDLDGVPVEQVPRAPGVDLEAVAGEYAALLRQARTLATEMDWGAPRSLSVRGARLQVTFGFLPSGDLAVGVETGPAGLSGHARYLVAEALFQLGNL